jgi:hypothetical protein
MRPRGFTCTSMSSMMLGGRHSSLLAAVVVSAVASVASAFPNTTTGHTLFAPFTLAATAEVPNTFLSFNFDVSACDAMYAACQHHVCTWTLIMQEFRNAVPVNRLGQRTRHCVNIHRPRASSGQPCAHVTVSTYTDLVPAVASHVNRLGQRTRHCVNIHRPRASSGQPCAHVTVSTFTGLVPAVASHVQAVVVRAWLHAWPLQTRMASCISKACGGAVHTAR